MALSGDPVDVLTHDSQFNARRKKKIIRWFMEWNGCYLLSTLYTQALLTFSDSTHVLS